MRSRILALPLFAAACAGPIASAQQLLVVGEQDNKLVRIDPHPPSGASAVVSEQPITGLGEWERVIGFNRRWFWDSGGGGWSILTIGLVLSTQAPDDTVATYRFWPDTASATSKSCLIDGGTFPPAFSAHISKWTASEMDQISFDDFSVLTVASGKVHSGFTLIGCSSAPQIGTVPKGTPYGATTRVGDFAYLLIDPDPMFGGGDDPLTLFRVEVQQAVNTPFKPPTVVDSWPVNLAVTPGHQYWKVLGIALSKDGYVYAYVNDVTSSLGHGVGDLIVARSTASIDDTPAGAPLTLEKTATVLSWANPGLGALDFPPVVMLFDPDGAPESVSLTASPSTAPEGCPVTLTANWSSGPPTAIIDPGAIEVANGGSVSVIPPAGTTQYTLTVTGMNGKVATDTASVSTLAFSVGIASTIEVCPDETVAATATVTNGSPPYSFVFKDANNGVVHSETTSNASSTWSVDKTVAEGSYSVSVTDACGATATAGFEVDQLTPAAIKENAKSTTICAGSSATLVFEISGDPSPDYWIYEEGTEVTSGTAVGDTISYTTPDLNESASFTLKVWNKCNDIPVPGAPVSVTVVHPPEITSDPVSEAVPEGATASFSVTATGDSPLGYQWSKDGIPIAGALSSTLTVGPVTTADAGTYSVEVSNPASNEGYCAPATASATLFVVPKPPAPTASQGTYQDRIALSWSAVANATKYRVLRADTESGVGEVELAVVEETAYDDLNAVPGRDYYYSIEASADGEAFTPASDLGSGWCALSPPANLVATSGTPAAPMKVTWDESAGAGTYRLWRSHLVNDPAFAVPVTDWIEDLSVENAGIAGETYYFFVEAAIDVMGTRSSGLGPASATNQASEVCRFPSCGDPLDPPPTAPGLLVLLDYSHNMNVVRPSTGNTRWQDAVALARQDILTFQSQCPYGSVAVWTFAGFCVSDLTDGFVDPDQAMLVIDSLPLVASNLQANLADSLCQGISTLCGCFPATGSGCVAFNPGSPGAVTDRILSVLSAGVEESSYGPCAGPDATSGDSCGTYVPANSWQSKVCNFLQPACATFMVREFDALSLPAGGPTPSLVDFAVQTGGIGQKVGDGSPLPPPLFDDCNGNGQADLLDIQLGVAQDCNENGIPDSCETASDCNGNGVPDSCDVASGFSLDLNGNGKPDECEGFVVTARPVPVAGVAVTLDAVGASPNTAIFYIAGLVPGNFPVPCPGVSLGIQDFLSYSLPLAWYSAVDGQGHAVLELPIPPAASGLTVLFQALELNPNCQAAPVLEVTFQ